ncbi:topoisomerase II medium subunit [Serratia phage 4S]|nr:topoisomerase II medium subunit [Serratia phage 4S]
MQLNDRSLESIYKNEALAYAMYTVENRAIPNMIDGLKPVQRFVMYRALLAARGDKSKFHKVASIAGGVSDAGYHHGEGSAQSACALMANTWNNNTPLLDGEGNFGSRLIQEGAAARYVFARVSQNWWNIYKDTEYAPKHEDEEHKPPAYYLPLVPTVLSNGVSGIATGYATSILPHSLASITKATIQAIQGKKISEPIVQFPAWHGQIIENDEGQFACGTFERQGKTKLRITEIPPKFDRIKYIKVLDALVDKGWITYEDDSGKNRFFFDVTLRKEFTQRDDDEVIMKEFKLRQKISQNIVVINGHGKLVEYEKASDLIKDFVEFRMPYVQARIDNKLEETKQAYLLATAKARFIARVLKNEIVISGRKKAEVIADIESYDELKEFSDKLISMNLYHITAEEARKLVEDAKASREQHEYWLNTTAEIEYTNDLKAIK